MMTMSPLSYDIPSTRETLEKSFEQVTQKTLDLWRACPPAAFFKTPDKSGWSPAQNLEHLMNGTAPVALALRMPTFVPWLVFGKPQRPSRSYEEVVAAYQEVLAQGGQAGKFGPKEADKPADAADAQAKMIEKWEVLMAGFLKALKRWEDDALDNYQLPHPLLGKLTFREMLFFTLYHIGRHAEVVRQRLQGSSA